MQLLWLVVAIVATVSYHVILKVTPAGVNPLLTLAVTYAAGAILYVVLYATIPGSAPLRESLQQLNWTALALALAVVGLDVGFLMLYRTGFDVSLGQLVTQSAASLALLLLGVAFFKEMLSLTNIGGILLCVAGLWLIHQR
jgi:multidrug transporter EmrE-like cation transporter